MTYLHHSLQICHYSIMYSVNDNVGAQDRMTMTGMYNMSDIFCVGCGATLGWKYVRFVAVIL
jgi:hypothetical protein